MVHHTKIIEINDAINSYSYYKTLEEDWDFEDGYLLAMMIYFEFNELGIYED